METNEIVRTNISIFRIIKIDVTNNKVLVIDCINKKMPYWDRLDNFINAESINYSDLLINTSKSYIPFNSLNPEEQRICLQRYTIISPVLAVLSNDSQRSAMINQQAEEYQLSKQTIRSVLRLYLIYQDIAVLAPTRRDTKELTNDEKNMRWALNKFFYTRNKNSLKTAYTMMLKEKYFSNGCLMDLYPSFYQFRYFYRKTRKLENFYISRDGIKDYQKNQRPLLGENVQQYAPQIGTAMLDGTICDIYIVDNKGNLVGRPILVAAIDANTSLCLGYSVLWEGGTYSLVQLMLSILENKTELCERFGIKITDDLWPNHNMMPGRFITDGGSEYVGQTFSQITELGIELIKLPSFRAELKGPVEKFFDLVQDSFKDVLKGKGVILPDWQERGAHDYRKDACLTIEEFERVVIKCIVFYNSSRILENYPYDEEMITMKVKPHANTIWKWKSEQHGADMLQVSTEQLQLTLLPRTNAKFTRQGLKANGLRYDAPGYKEQYLSGGSAVVAYDPDDCSRVWLKEKGGCFVEFRLIEKRYEEKSLSDVKSFKESQAKIVDDERTKTLEDKIELISFIETVANAHNNNGNVSIKNVRENRTREKRRKHKVKGAINNE